MFLNLDSKSAEISLTRAHAPVYIWSKIIGLSCFTVEPNGKSDHSKKNLKFSFNIFWLFYTIIILGVYLGCYSKCVLEFYSGTNNDVIKEFPSITTVGTVLHILLGVFTTILNFTFCIINFKNLEFILSHLQRIDDDLNAIHINEKINYPQIFKFQIKLIISGLVIFGSVFIYGFIVQWYLFESKFIYIIIVYLIPYLSAIVVEFKFIVGVYNIYHRLHLINMFLENIAIVNKPTSKAVTLYHSANKSDNLATKDKLFTITSETSNIEDLEDEDRPPSYSKLTDNLNLEKKDDLSNSQETEPQDTKQKKKKKLKIENYDSYKNLHLKANEIFILHDKLCDISEVINDTFAVQLVACITKSFIVILFGFFFETKVIFWKIDFELICVASSFLGWAIILGITTQTILVYCTATKEQANESALIVHKILQNKPAFMLNDETFYSKMKSFTLQVLHRKNTFHFNGLGLFRLDYTFIFSVVSAATSYLIVLLQFDLTKDLDGYGNSKMNRTNRSNSLFG